MDSEANLCDEVELHEGDVQGLADSTEHEHEWPVDTHWVLVSLNHGHVSTILGLPIFVLDEVLVLAQEEQCEDPEARE